MTGSLRLGGLLGWAALGTTLLLYGLAAGYAAYLLLLLAVVGTAYLLVVQRGRLGPPDDATTGFVVAFGLLVVAHELSAPAPREALIVVNFIWLLLFTPLRALLARMARPQAGVIVARLALAGAAATFAFAVYQRLGLRIDRVGSVNSDPIRMANTALILGFASLVGLLADTGWKRFVYLAGPALGFGVAALAETRGAMVSGVLMAVVATFLLVRRKRFAALLALGLGLLGIAALLVAAQLHFARAHLLVRSISELLSGATIANNSSRIRWNLLRASWSAFEASPWYGHGWSRLISAVRPFLPKGLRLAGAPHLHNDIADFAVGSGIIGLAAYAMLLLAPVLAALRSTRDALYRPRVAGVVLLVASYAALGVNSLMFGYEVHTSLYVGLAAVFLGFCAPPVAEVRQ